MVGVRVLVPIALAALLSACGEEGGGIGLPVYTPAAVASATSVAPAAATATPTTTPTPSATGPADSVSVTAGEIRAKGGGHAVAAAWVAYWQERLTAVHELDAERPQLLAVASGNALEQVRAEVAQLRSRGQHRIGTAVVGVSRIRVGAAGARITSCLENTSTDVDAQLRPAAEAVPRFGLDGTAVRAGGGWQITHVAVTGTGTCAAA